MRNFITFLALIVLFAFTSCSLDNEEYIINNQEINAVENSFKTAVVTYDLTTEVITKDNLRTELNIQNSFDQSKNTVVWLLKASESIAVLEELIALSDGVVSVQVSEGEVMFKDLLEREGDTKGNGDTDSDEEREGDTKGNGDTDSDEEREGDTKGNGDTDSDEEREGGTKGNGDTDSDEEREGDTKGNGDTDSDEEREGDTKGNGDTDSDEEREGDTKGNGDTDSDEEKSGKQ